MPLAPGCEKRPASPDLNYVPKGSFKYKVKGGDDFWKLAARPEVKAQGWSALDLCFFNFKTRVPAEINWYLYNKVGCRQMTKDKKNYMFSTSDSPGEIYLPILDAGETIIVGPGPVEQPETRLNTWFGIGGKLGTQFFVVGTEQINAWVMSLDDFGQGFWMNAKNSRLGPGVGASGGPMGVYISSMKRPSQLQGHMTGGWDFNVSLGAKVSELAKFKKLKPVIEIARKLGARSPAALKSIVTNFDKWNDLRKAFLSIPEALKMETDAMEPQVLLFDIWGFGTEVSVYYGVTDYNVVLDSFS